MPITAMTCAICCQPLASDGPPTVPLPCLHTFHKECLHEWHKAHGLDDSKAMKCPTCKLTHSDMAEKKAAVKPHDAGVHHSQSVPENWKSQSSQDEYSTAPGVASELCPDAKRLKWNDTQDRPVERRVPGGWSPKRPDPKDNAAPATPVQSQTMDSQWTQDSPRGGDSPGVTNEDFKFSFKDATKRSSDREREISDPVVAALENVRKAQSQRELAKAVHSLTLFDGFHNEQAAYNTVTKRLEEIVADTRSHKDMVSEVQFAVRNLVPLPFAEAIKALALGEGWHPECLVQEVGARAAFVEHHGTQLGEKEFTQDIRRRNDLQEQRLPA